MIKWIARGAAVLACACVTGPLLACATCGCTLNSDAAIGYSIEPGWRLSLEYDYIHQDELRSGRRRVATVPTGSELERETLNRYITVGADFNPSPNWDFAVRMPYVLRTHSTYGEYDPALPLPEPSSSHSSSLGDLRLVGSYQGFLDGHNLGVQAGVKLPTGHYGTDVKFSTGPAAGEPVDASLQPGTGSTDAIVGAYYYQVLGQSLQLMATGQFQSAIAHRQHEAGNDFSPGNSTTLSLGARYVQDVRWIPALQVNLLHKGVDHGALADITDTAGTVAYVSPGMTLRPIDRLHVFGFFQIPVYSNLVGYQVFPRYTVSVGASWEL